MEDLEGQRGRGRGGRTGEWRCWRVVDFRFRSCFSFGFGFDSDSDVGCIECNGVRIRIRIRIRIEEEDEEQDEESAAISREIDINICIHIGYLFVCLYKIEKSTSETYIVTLEQRRRGRGGREG